DEQVDRIVDKWVAYENEIKEVRHQKAIKIEAFDRASRNVQMKYMQMSIREEYEKGQAKKLEAYKNGKQY
ncbi:MAG: hypothetical protein U9R16_04395, partial [Campylobacterota bacterium]|nr:hypothetical protein [Campylobacterota bacterium]